MSARSNSPNHDDDERRDQDDIDLRYRPYEWDEREHDEPEIPTRRAVDGWATEKEPETAWWVKAGIAIISILIVLGLVAGLAGPFLGSFGSNDRQRSNTYPLRSKTSSTSAPSPLKSTAYSKPSGTSASNHCRSTAPGTTSASWRTSNSSPEKKYCSKQTESTPTTLDACSGTYTPIKTWSTASCYATALHYHPSDKTD